MSLYNVNKIIEYLRTNALESRDYFLVKISKMDWAILFENECSTCGGIMHRWGYSKKFDFRYRCKNCHKTKIIRNIDNEPRVDRRFRPYTNEAV